MAARKSTARSRSQITPLWRGVAEASDSIAEHVANIPAVATLAPDSIAELSRALKLLTEADVLLGRTAEREERLYAESPEATGAQRH